jgi:hypothetical protein
MESDSGAAILHYPKYHYLVVASRCRVQGTCTKHELNLCSSVPLERPQVVQPLGSFPAFMEPEGSIPSSQELYTCAYLEPEQSSLQHTILSLIGPS